MSGVTTAAVALLPREKQTKNKPKRSEFEAAVVAQVLHFSRTGIEARYLGCCEAAWSIFVFPTTERFSSVLDSTLHEPAGRIFYYGDSQATDHSQSSDKTVLTKFFAHNAAATTAAAAAVDNDSYDDDGDDDDDAAGNADVALCLLYQDFPTYSTWNRARKRWKPGQRRAG